MPFAENDRVKDVWWRLDIPANAQKALSSGFTSVPFCALGRRTVRRILEVAESVRAALIAAHKLRRALYSRTESTLPTL